MLKGHWDWVPFLESLGILTAAIANTIYRDRGRLYRTLMVAVALVLIVLFFIQILRG
jgi:hypothetical protein